RLHRVERALKARLHRVERALKARLHRVERALKARLHRVERALKARCSSHLRREGGGLRVRSRSSDVRVEVPPPGLAPPT
ncbi:hypothetical protein ACIBCU_37715, partial [Streptomyces sp. NPDC051064]|uniref:hypothetical protein n=1 Tax=Streptomyces sp. NPDC051064 TaxID=3365641 RepID=UPI00378E0562